MKLLTAISAATLLLLGLQTPALAKQVVYKCQSAQGGIPQYVALPINGQKCQQVKIDGRLPPSAMAASRAAPQATAQAATNTPPKVKEIGSEGSKPSAQECAQIQQIGETLATGRRIYEVDEKGERRHLDDATRLERQKQYQELAKSCQ